MPRKSCHHQNLMREQLNFQLSMDCSNLKKKENKNRGQKVRRTTTIKTWLFPWILWKPCNEVKVPNENCDECSYEFKEQTTKINYKCHMHFIILKDLVIQSVGYSYWAKAQQKRPTLSRPLHRRVLFHSDAFSPIRPTPSDEWDRTLRTK